MPVISSEVEQSLDMFERTRDLSTSLEMTGKLFGELEVYDDMSPHSAAMNMAIDEALLEYATAPCIRFYHWQCPARSFGYFGKFRDVADYASGHDLVRRWTGGGIVLHGEDLTYAIVIPANAPAFNESSPSIYERVHRALCRVLNVIGNRAELVGPARCADRTVRAGLALQHGVSSSNCFTNPVRADVMVDSRKIAGAAQRRTRRGLLQQGSIQGVELKDGFAKRFADALSANRTQHDISEEILIRARELAQQKYGTESWLRKR
jgi:lipoyl(octanoyl) transferase